MNSRLLISILCMCAALTLHSQSSIEPLKEELFPESPSAATLKAIDMPSASLLTGAATFDVPLYTINVQGYALPISLRYHSNGVKYDDDPRPVGLGWSLLPGLRVVRKIQGRPDGEFTRAELIPNYRNPSFSTLLPAGSEYMEEYRKYYRCMTEHFAYTSKKDERYDSEYDIFTAYLPETAITFTIVNGIVVGPGLTQYRIRIDQGIKGFHITDPNGIIYNFTISGAWVHKKECVNEWYLQNIELPSGDKITFGYSEAHELHENKFSRATTTLTYGIQGIDNYTAMFGVSSNWLIESDGFKELTAISFPGGGVSLKYGMVSHLLEKFSVVNEGASVVDVSFKYGNNNLLLKEIIDSRSGSYKFDYNEQKPCNSRDWWGYCNSSTDVLQVTPSLNLQNLNSHGASYFIAGASRTPDLSYATANILTKATFPTGGIVEWEYSMHSLGAVLTDSIGLRHTGERYIGSGGGLCVRTITLYNGPDDRSPRRREYVYGTRGMERSRYTAIPWPHTFVEKRTHFGFYVEPALEGGYNLFSLERGLVEVQLHSRYMEFQDGKLPVWCDEVTELEPEGKTVYRFKDFIPDNKILHEFGASFPDTLYSIFSGGPQLVEKTVYKSTGYTSYEPVLKETFEYDVLRGNEYSDHHLKRRKVQTQKYEDDFAPDFGEERYFTWSCDPYRLISMPKPYGWGYTWTPDLMGLMVGDPTVDIKPNEVYTCKRYTVVPMRERLRSKTVTEYTDNGPVSRTESYGYVDHSGIVNSVETAVGEDRSRLTLRYAERSDSSLMLLRWTPVPKDSTFLIGGSTIEDRMVAKNMIGIPIETTMTVADSRTVARNDMASMHTKLILPRAVRSGRGDTLFTAAEYAYDTRGNLACVKRPDGTRTAWLWGYNYRHPVYRIDGIDYTDLSAYTGGDAQNHELTTAALGVPVARRLYKPLVGVSEERDAAGVTTRYTYDASCRLVSTEVEGLGTMAQYAYDINNGGVSRVTADRWLDAKGNIKARTMQVYDALGRLRSNMMRVRNTWSGDLTEYDAMGRPCRQWSAAPCTSESDSPEEITAAAIDFYSDTSPFAGTVYEASPLQRAIASVKPGAEHHDQNHRATYRRLANYGAGYRCPRYRIVPDGIDSDGYYPEGTLIIDETVDEDGVALQTFTDWRGLKVLERRGSSESWLCTRYIYDGYGDLRYVLPPKLADGDYRRTDDAFSALAYWYDYDARGNIVLRKLPGADPVEYFYDPAGRLAAESGGMRDAGSYQEAVWLLHHYDGMGREMALSEVACIEDDAEEFASQVRVLEWDGVHSPFVEYTGGDYCLVNDATPLTMRRFDAAGRVIEEYAGEITRSYSYDALGRTSTLVERYTSGPVLTHSYTYTHQGEPETEHIESTAEHHRPIDRLWRYDDSGRLTECWTDAGTGYLARARYQHDYPFDSIGAIKTVYDAVGRVSRHQYGERIVRDYTYNTDGSMAQICTYSRFPGIFRPPIVRPAPFRSSYAFIDTILPLPETFLRDPFNYIKDEYTVIQTLCDSLNRLPSGRLLSRQACGAGYTYGYDRYGRLESATVGLAGDPEADMSTRYRYDANGNIDYMQRYGVVDRVGDALIYGLQSQSAMNIAGNQITALWHVYEGEVYEGVTDFTTSTAYPLTYDSRGNLRSDSSRDIKRIEYNHLNQPTRIDMGKAGTLVMRYDGTGQLVARERRGVGGVWFLSDSWNQYYHGMHEFNSADSIIDRVHFDGGYIDDDGKVYYHIGDYQGNVVAVMRGNGIVVQTAHYYPYGEPWLEPDGINRRLYGGKERIAALGGAYDFGARLLNSRVGTWYQQDPCAEDYRWLSPYSVCAADPVNHIDPDGRKFTEASMLTYGNYLSDAWRRYVEADVDLKDQYLEVITELMTMEASDQLFHVQTISPLLSIGYTYYDLGMNAVVMSLPGGGSGDIGLIAHEFKHGYQFLMGEIEFGIETMVSRSNFFFYDLVDEIEAYDRASLFGADRFSIDEIVEMYPHITNKNRSNYTDIPGFADKTLEEQHEYLMKYARKVKRAFRVKNHTYKP